MRCERASEIDADNFLIDASADEFASFRAHYATCSDCSSAVARWQALTVALEEIATSAAGRSGVHLEPELLDAYLRAPSELGDQAQRVATHLADCAMCRTELTLLERFDPALLADPGTKAHGAAVIPISSRFRDRVKSVFGSTSPAGWGVVAAAALALIALWVGGAFESTLRSPGDAPRLADVGHTSKPATPAPATAPAPTADPDADLAPDGSAERIVAHVPPAEPATDARPTPVERRSPDGNSPVAGAEERLARGTDSDPGISSEHVVESEGSEEVILLAALTELPAPSYRRPGTAARLDWMDQFGAVRAGVGQPSVAVLAPASHTGRTRTPAPRLWWTLDRPVEVAVRMTVSEATAIEPLVEIELPGPQTAGRHAIDLHRHDVTLVPGVAYQWFVMVLVDPDRPSVNPVSAGSIEYVPDRALDPAASVAEVGHRAAEAGFWYDAIDFFAHQAQLHPDVPELAAHLDQLLEQGQID